MAHFLKRSWKRVLLLSVKCCDKLPFSKRNMDIVKRVMITEQNSAYTIRSKTGWTMANDMNTGWWVGYLEKKDEVYFFATRSILKDLKVFE
jgi:beta-lactamase class D